jgi:hypothetical protein
MTAPNPDEPDRIEERTAEADARDEAARRRDVKAKARDMVELQWLAEVTRREDALAGKSSGVPDMIQHAAEVRRRAAAARAAAAEDRAAAAADREWAAAERAEIGREMKSAGSDESTGALQGGFGEEALRGEIARAHRDGGRLVLAVVATAESDDDSLRGVVDAIRAARRNYEPIVRVRRNMVAFTIGGVGKDRAPKRLEQIGEAVKSKSGGMHVSLSFAVLRAKDSLEELLGRALGAARPRGHRVRP